MALFKKDKQEKKTKAPETKERKQQDAAAAQQELDSLQDLSWVLLQPRISEKAFMVTERNVYVFEVDPRANKIQIKEALKQYYQVTPKKVRIVNMPAKKKVSLRTGIVGKTKRIKKAYVYLNEGDTISLT